ncbi:putative Toxin secretion ABC transporter (ATP-binding and membrane protein); hlyB-like protein [Bradyrhizobium sp. ORS 375]|uniref:peptidase domain-containing ABC transporter n=1 Tax=Bradyrhizobium sp. (strain ORS 375) TaxID=566679 RepID=UPI000240A70E|nr:peptidase domain-containing ABC transporter [Bradyrhizobium sp. ORS 375]CCD91731.1 putative Toxin secretion ABC transporter (ATP-binding and membrane protein); hlyB-like protein [Bradyrhizobium sp. ORS 375]
MVPQPAPLSPSFDAAQDGAAPTGLAALVIVARQHGLHLTVSQLIHDNVLSGAEVSTAEIVKSANNSGMTAKVVKLDWDGLSHLKRALPAIVRLKDGSSMVLLRLEGDENNPRVVLRDPNVDDDTLLVIDRLRLEDVWTGDVVLVKRDYEISDETQPFSLGLITALIFRERRIVRDVAVAALVLGLMGLAPIMFYRLLSEKVLYYKAFSTFSVLCVAMLVLIAFESAFAFLRQFLVHQLTARLDVKLSTYMFEKVLNLPIDFFERNQVGMVARDMREIFRIRTFLMGQLFGTILDSTTLIFFLPVMFFFSPIMTFAVLAFVALIAVWLLAMLPVYRKRSNAVLSAEGVLGAFMVQTLNGIRTVKSLALDARQKHMWDVYVARVAKARVAEGMAGTIIQAVVRPLERLAVTAPYALGVYLAITTDDPLFVGALFAFLLLSQRVAAPLMQMAQLINQYDEARSAVGIVGQLVNQPAEEGRTGHGVRAPLKGHIEFSGVTFKYKGAVSPALNDLSFEIPVGGTLGVMGKSGSGKTTITRLLQRLHSDYGGLIKIDGVDVREYDVDHLRRNVGVVLQENFLFSGTIRENISAAKPDATFDEIVRAARLAGAEEFIDKLPRGYETYIYEGSPNLSGGQRQRLAIARALLVNPPILILDEATSALDADSEAIVNANIARIGHGRTMIIISHRLSSLVDCDAILVLNRGVIDDIGRHDELLDRNEIYSSLWHQQNSHAIAAPRRGRPGYGGPTLVS